MYKDRFLKEKEPAPSENEEDAVGATQNWHT